MDQPELRQLQQEFDYLLVTTLEGAYAKGCKGLSMWCALRKAFGREINFLLAHDTLYALADDVVHNRAAPPELSTFLLTWL